MQNCICLIKTRICHLSTLLTNIWMIFFLLTKMGKLAKTQNLAIIVLITHFSWSSDSHFRSKPRSYQLKNERKCVRRHVVCGVYRVDINSWFLAQTSSMQKQTMWSINTLPGTSSRGGGLILEMIQVCDYDILIVLVELNTLI